MKKHNHIGIAALAAMFTALAVEAQVQGVVITPEGRKIEGTIKWVPRDKAYGIVAKGGANVELQMAPDKIAELQIPRPRELDTAIKAISDGNAAAAVPALEKIASEYLMLQWDTVATRYLADALVQSGKVDDALRVCEKVIAANPDAAFLGEMAPAYWQALIKKDRISRVEGLITKAIKTGDRAASANALIARGDLVLASGDTAEIAKKALRDGYLRVVSLYKSERDAQPEALYKAAQCFDKIGLSARADQMRSQLKGEYGASAWARK